MVPKTKNEIAYDRQASTYSYLTFSTVDDSHDSVATSSTKRFVSTSSLSVFNLAVSVVVYAVCMFGKQHLVPSHEQAYHRPHPHQTTSSGDVIYNFEWNHPLVHPASVPSTCAFVTLVTGSAIIFSHNFQTLRLHSQQECCIKEVLYFLWY